MTEPIRPFLDSLAGKRIPGGCPQCEAEQRLDEVSPNTWALVVAHEGTCPFMRAMEAETN